MVDGKGTEVLKGRFPTTYDGLSEFASTLPEGARVAIVASGMFVYEYLGERGGEVHWHIRSMSSRSRRSM